MICSFATDADIILKFRTFLLSDTVFLNRHMKKLRCVPFAGILISEAMKGEDGMPNDDFYIVCPYYHKARGNELFCDSFSGDKSFSIDECHIKQIFSDRAERNLFIKKYCGGFEYLSCAIAAVNEQLNHRK